MANKGLWEPTTPTFLKDPVLEKAAARKRLYTELDDKENNPKHGRTRKDIPTPLSTSTPALVINTIEDISYWWD